MDLISLNVVVDIISLNGKSGTGLLFNLTCGEGISLRLTALGIMVVTLLRLINGAEVTLLRLINGAEVTSLRLIVGMNTELASHKPLLTESELGQHLPKPLNLQWDSHKMKEATDVPLATAERLLNRYSPDDG